MLLTSLRATLQKFQLQNLRDSSWFAIKNIFIKECQNWQVEICYQADIRPCRMFKFEWFPNHKLNNSSLATFITFCLGSKVIIAFIWTIVNFGEFKSWIFLSDIVSLGTGSDILSCLTLYSNCENVDNLHPPEFLENPFSKWILFKICCIFELRVNFFNAF